MIRIALIALVMTMLAQPAAAQSWDGSRAGRITSIEVTSAANFAFRIYIDGSPMCANGPNWAYINKSWDNYDAAVALLTAAYLSNKNVFVLSRSVNGFCEIGHLAFQ